MKPFFASSDNLYSGEIHGRKGAELMLPTSFGRRSHGAASIVASGVLPNGASVPW
jgi:hypothetical protein